jgi:hypothetical protein
LGAPDPDLEPHPAAQHGGPPQFQQLLAQGKAHAGATNVLVTLDNEPELWSQTHAPEHPVHATYEEVVARNVAYATMVRDT